MPQTRDITVTGSREAIARVAARLRDRATSPWSLADVPEQGRRLDAGDGTYLILAFAGAAKRAGAAKVWLTVEAEQIQLGNVLVDGNRDLDEDAMVAAYNRVAERLFADLIAPAAEAEGAHAELGPAEPGLADWMSAETADALRRFSGAANQSTGIAHPNDRRRFFDFLLAAHAEGADLTETDLEGWLRKEGWPERHVDKIARYYEFGRALLARADEKRAGTGRPGA